MEKARLCGIPARFLQRCKTKAAPAPAPAHSSSAWSLSCRSCPLTFPEMSWLVVWTSLACCLGMLTCVVEHTSWQRSAWRRIHGSNWLRDRRKIHLVLSREEGFQMKNANVDMHSFLSVLSAYAVFLGPMIGLLCTHFYIIQKRRFHVPDLYHGSRKSIYWYNYGVNWRTVVAWVAAVFPR